MHMYAGYSINGQTLLTLPSVPHFLLIQLWPSYLCAKWTYPGSSALHFPLPKGHDSKSPSQKISSHRSRSPTALKARWAIYLHAGIEYRDIIPPDSGVTCTHTAIKLPPRHPPTSSEGWILIAEIPTLHPVAALVFSLLRLGPPVMLLFLGARELVKKKENKNAPSNWAENLV